jgi:hypothetical protein
MHAPGVQIKRGKRAVKPKSLHLFISTSLIPLIVLQASIAQIKIKERIEIKPQKNSSIQQSVSGDSDIVAIEANWIPASVGRLFADGYETQYGGNGHISVSVPMPKKTEGCYYSHFVDLQIQIGTVLPQITHATLRRRQGGVLSRLVDALRQHRE